MTYPRLVLHMDSPALRVHAAGSCHGDAAAAAAAVVR